MKYEVGDRVRIKSIDWYNENKNENNGVQCGNFIFYAAQYCGFTVTIALVNMNAGCYIMKEIDDVWTDEMIEGLVEEEDLIPKFGEYSDNEPLDVPTMAIDFVKEHGLPCPNGYIFKDENGNVINTTKIVLEKKECPKTYEECCEIIGLCSDTLKWSNPFCINRDTHPYIKHLDNLIERFCKLLICRDAYWKIAGEEMGLDKSWEPDWKNSEERRYCIVNIEGDINLPETTLTKWILKVTNKILVFPTEEMRDAFYEAFKGEIEKCKELL